MGINQFIIEKLKKNNNKYELTIKSIDTEKKNFENISVEMLGEILSKNLLYENRTIFLPKKSIKKNYFSKTSKLKKINFKQGEILFSNELDLEILFDDKIINIIQTNHDDWILFSDLKLENWTINFKGIQLKNIKKNFNKMNSHGMTGCVNFFNIEFDNSQIFSTDGLCEDSINLVNSYGLINLIDIKNASADGLDVDFSDIQINKLIINLAYNDCVDFSKGKYNIFNIELSDCSDKGISVGEESILQLKKGIVNNSEIGIASKDSSIAKIDNIIFKNVDTCFSSYNKKQEFYGSVLKVLNSRCENYEKKSYIDKNSEIKIN